MDDSNMSSLVLGLDLGETSLGSALVRLDSEEGLLGIEWLGARLFTAPVEPKSKELLNAQRQKARSQRRGHQRSGRRRAKLENLLVRYGLLPAEEAERDIVVGRAGSVEDRAKFDPYRLRSEALDRELEAFELGRVLTHLAHRRGFLSNKKTRLSDILKDDPGLFDGEEMPEDNRKAPKADPDKEKAEEGIVLAEIASLQDQLDGATLGQFLDQRLQRASARRAAGEPPDGDDKVRGLRTSRSMYVEEFERIWEKQSEFHSILRDESLKELVAQAFRQRPLKPVRWKRPKMTRDTDEEVQQALEAASKSCRLFKKLTASKAGNFYAQRFRILQTLRNVRVIEDGGERPLTDPQVRLAAEHLQTQDLTWGALRKLLGMNAKESKFNLELVFKGPKDIKRNATEAHLKNVLGDRWCNDLELPRETLDRQLEFMQDIETARNPKALFYLLQNPKQNGNPLFPLSKADAYAIAGFAYLQTRGAYSARACRKLSDLLLAGAASTYEAEQTLATESRACALARLPEPPFVPNSRVRKGLYQVRRVVNAYIDKFGKPDVIRIELARDIRQTKRERERTAATQDRNRKAREAARSFYKENGIDDPSSDQLLKHTLWIECSNECPYTGKPISCDDLLSERTEIEHILPLTRTADDGYRNKTLTFQETNQAKGNKTPREWLGSGSQQYEEARKRFEAMRKSRVFETEEISEDFTSRQLADTAYMSRLAREYLELLGVSVVTTNGRATSTLRRLWGLNGLLDDRSTASATKTRDDHRHHAVDALVIALTTPKWFRQAVLDARGGAPTKKGPGDGLRRAAWALLEHVNVSHSVDKGISGPLHDDWYYGRIKGKEFFVRRVPINHFISKGPKGKKTKSPREAAKKKLEAVYDLDMRNRLERRLSLFPDTKESIHEAFGGSEGFILLEDGAGRKMRVESVRVKHRMVTEKTAVYMGHGRWAKPNSNHHAEIVKNRKGRFECRVVTMLEAAKAIAGSTSPTGARPEIAERIKARAEEGKRSPSGLTVGPGETLHRVLYKDEVVRHEGALYRIKGVSDGELTLIGLAAAERGQKMVRVASSDDWGALASAELSVLGELRDEP